MVISKSAKCSNCLNFKEPYPKESAIYEYGIGCKEHYQRFWDVLEEETNLCPYYEPYQLEFQLPLS